MFKVLDKVCVPKRSTKYSAYVDLFAREDVTIGAGETKVIPLGVKLDLDTLYKNWFYYTDKFKDKESWGQFKKSNYLEIALRSSLAVKGLIISNGIGVVDLDFAGELGLIVHNPIKMSTNQGIPDKYLLRPFYIKKGQKVCQCVLKEHKGYLMGYESDIIRNGGFGSTDKGIYNDK